MVTILYIRSPELIHLSDGINRRISANISPDFQVYILPVMLEITQSFNYLLNFFSSVDLGKQREIILKAVSWFSLFRIIRRLLKAGVFSGIILKSFGCGLIGLDSSFFLQNLHAPTSYQKSNLSCSDFSKCSHNKQ